MLADMTGFDVYTMQLGCLISYTSAEEALLVKESYADLRKILDMQGGVISLRALELDDDHGAVELQDEFFGPLTLEDEDTSTVVSDSPSAAGSADESAATEKPDPELSVEKGSEPQS